MTVFDFRTTCEIIFTKDGYEARFKREEIEMRGYGSTPELALANLRKKYEKEHGVSG